MSSALALFSALLWGTSDFIGGRAATRVPATAVVFGAASVSAVLAAIVSLVLGEHAGLGAALMWGAIGGIGTGGGGMALFKGLSSGRASVVAPVSSVLAAGFPVVVGLFGGEAPSATDRWGMGLAFVAILLLSRPVSTESRRASGFGYAVLAGLGFGLLFVALDAAPDGSGMWPVAASKVSSLLLVGTLVVGRSGTIRRVAATWRPIVAVGVIDMAAATSFLLATRSGLLSLSAVLTALYPAPTVALSALMTGERVGPLHAVGGVMAVTAAALIAL